MDLDSLFGLGDESNPLMMLVWILPIILFVFYGQRIQLMVTSGDIKKSISRLDGYRAESESELVGFVRGRAGGGSGADPAPRIGQFLDYFTIMPVDMDPAGLVGKVQHVVRSREDHTRRHVRSLCGGMGEDDLSRTQTLLEIASTLRLLHRAVNHMYLTAKKQKNFPLILPLQMMLPFLMEQAKALRDAVPAFKAGQPVGDGIGPMVVGRMMSGVAAKSEAAFQTVWCESSVEGRTVYLMKARGPNSAVGRPGEGVRNLASGRSLDAIITVDAALRMEGEKSATVARGFGAAMGGIGTERFHIEEVAAERGIPVFAVVVKQTVGEALGLMTREIAEKADEARSHVLSTILENTEEGQSVLVVGVGNTAGVAQ